MPTCMPTELPDLWYDQNSLPELVGAMIDSTVLAEDAIRFDALKAAAAATIAAA
jgi:hypothetical protein